MAIIRFHALDQVSYRKPRLIEPPAKKISDYFGMNVFTLEKMQRYLSNDVYRGVLACVEQGSRIDRKLADRVASGMKLWAIEMGATHYSHWFHPLTDGTAEKHDAFLDRGDFNKIIENFSGKHLAQQEPDASSFPSGGLRNTFEARGYTAWDPSSPAFIVGKTLSIPTIFISYTGQALDHKTPLLRSLNALDKAAASICQHFDKEVTRVIATLGWEQEYFLIDEALYNARPDLVLTDRTLMGHASAKDQQLDDHYFSSIPERVSAFMYEMEMEAYKLGIPVKTRHNEVAPSQYEVATLYEECNLAVDHNLLMMDLMKRVAKQHSFRVLFHEKPYKGINGSGKHNNWSLMTNTGLNLLAPTSKPKLNLQFLTFLVCTVKAVYENQDLIRASIVSASNALRLGSQEAPPSIMSVFIGSQVTGMLDDLEKRITNKKMTPSEKTDIKLDIAKIPEILVDNTDRNRTSPFAFTGNRFEFRAVGSSANCAAAMIVLNTAVTDQLITFNTEAETLINKGVKKDEAFFQVLRKYITASKPIRFEGNSYSDKWKGEAQKRGLTDISNVPEALEAYLSNESINLFTRHKVLSDNELIGRTEVRFEIYIKRIQIESRILGDLALNHIVPTAIIYQTSLIENVKGMKELYSQKDYNELAEARLALIKKLSKLISGIKLSVNEMNKARSLANKTENIHERAKVYTNKIIPFFNNIRESIDELELIVDDEIWPLPKYRELLFFK